MHATIVQNAYKQNEVLDIVNSLEDLCSPNDSYGWASAGIYSFWDYNTKEVLYIGLAVDLAERFKQHNGIIPMRENGCKFIKIQEYFTTNEKLGYSVFLQSPLSQPVTRKNIDTWFKHDLSQVSTRDFVYEQSKNDLRQIEGILIEAFRMRHNRLPSWNSVGGSISGQRNTTEGNYDIVYDFSHQRNSPLVSRSTLKELSENPTYELYENFLHGIRQYMLYSRISFDEALPHILKIDHLKIFERIIEEDYLKKKLLY
ncbi:TPA: GIY-YIG nuclease family protein [Bacillus cereus]|uniref:GIY-YIG nuclease family protein n=2 Tax=Bacillaceae TaxID=186817 RepID=UPI00122F9C97|nr:MULTISPECIES: GIY-YIG nuclease family protein [Bacillus]HDR7980571.1 GIY-YIG nuclease family protein [Bacillus cereus]MBJ7947136.1 GIY-YIG nuclease family protein [Bacillus cereus group sp. N24]QEQ16302.1 GIY-YIG nuclease family protein [Bacillus sp. BS98]HDR8058522.1 GIY-YIG nuclease family protein [Bacillus cereus]HDR8415534.1 GIY-YIG nuclease family protein [Bacillus cereus]